MNKFLIAIATVSLLASCSGKKSTIYENDTDFHDWVNQRSIKVRDNAHSGSSVSVLDSANVFSLGFSRTIEKISSKTVSEVRFSYWYFATSPNAKITTVCSVDFTGKNVQWEGHPVKQVELNKWIQVEEIYKFSNNVKQNNEVAVYVLNESKEEILIDDLKVEFK